MRGNGCGESMKKEVTIEERATLLEGKNVWETHSHEGRNLFMADGPHGLRKQRNVNDHLGSEGSEVAICYPTASLLACSFDTELIKKLGTHLAEEAKAMGVNIVLGPGINIKRNPLCGRNFEYFSEDPYLTAALGAAYVRAVEDKGVGVSVKHFCCNNQETFRYHADSIVDERTLHEIYLKAFRACIKEKPATLMASYNRLNGFYTTEHPMLKTILRKDWGYQGVLVSDWGAISNRVAAVKSGLDLEMPSSQGYHTQELIKEAKVSDEVRVAINESYQRVVKTIDAYQFDSNQDEEKSVSLDAHHEVARNIASESMVLLKNEGILPLRAQEKVLFVGAFTKQFRYQGGGSSFINPYRVEQIENNLINYTDYPACIEGYTLEGDGFDKELYQEAIEKAGLYHKIVLFLGLPLPYETEGLDRPNLDLPLGQERLIKGLIQVNPNIVCVVCSGSVVNLTLPSLGKGLLMAYLSGEAGALAILDILYGKVNPSGRLAETMIESAADCNTKITRQDRVYYDEAIYVGYRYYETFKKPVVYPFGYGLSYSTFAYRDLSISNRILNQPITVSCFVKNTGSFAGKTVVQLYIENNHSSVYKPLRELRAFQKIHLEPSEEKKVSFTITKEGIAYYDVNAHAFLSNAGEYKIQICENVSHVLLEELVALVEEDPRFVEHPKTSYHKVQYDTSDFRVIYGKELPPETMKRRPFTMDSTILHLRASLLGLIIGSLIMSLANKTVKAPEKWLEVVMKKTIQETPIRSLALMSDGALPLMVASGIIDLCNWHLIRGIKKIVKGMHHHEVV